MVIENINIRYFIIIASILTIIINTGVNIYIFQRRRVDDRRGVDIDLWFKTLEKAMPLFADSILKQSETATIYATNCYKKDGVTINDDDYKSITKLIGESSSILRCVYLYMLTLNEKEIANNIDRLSNLLIDFAFIIEDINSGEIDNSDRIQEISGMIATTEEIIEENLTGLIDRKLIHNK